MVFLDVQDFTTEFLSQDDPVILSDNRFWVFNLFIVAVKHMIAVAFPTDN